MDAMSTFGSLVLSEGAMAIVTPIPGLNLPKSEWTQRDILQADTAFVAETAVVTPDSNPASAILATVMSIAALKEVAIPPKTNSWEDEEEALEERDLEENAKT